MGTTSTAATVNWTVVKDATGNPTAVSGDDVSIFMNDSGPGFSGEAWCDVDPMAAIPAGATITDCTFTFDEQVTGSRQNPSVPVSPLAEFYDKAPYLAGTFLASYARFGAGGVGNLANDGSVHALEYRQSVYGPLSGGAGVADMDVFAAALANPSTPIILRVQASNGSTGTSLTYFAPLTITFEWTGGSTIIPPLRRYPRSDGLGSSSARRVYPAAPSTQASNRRAGGYY